MIGCTCNFPNNQHTPECQTLTRKPLPTLTPNPSTPNCHSATDGECSWSECPQNRDGEPDKSGRHCPYDTKSNDPDAGQYRAWEPNSDYAVEQALTKPVVPESKNDVETTASRRAMEGLRHAIRERDETIAFMRKNYEVVTRSLDEYKANLEECKRDLLREKTDTRNLLNSLNGKEDERRTHRNILQAWADSYAVEESGEVRDLALWNACTQKLTMRVPLGVTRKPAEVIPIPMLIWCPWCGDRHIDEGDFLTKPHATHACQTCGHTWRASIVPTVGVRFLPGFKNP